MEKICEFKNRDGLKLVGILHSPEDNAQDYGFLFIHSGVQGRHGNTNQYVFYAREFCKMGFPCFRFEPYGMGDSEGIIEPMPMRDYYGSIQTGRYVNDTLDAIEYFNSTGVKKIILFGLCGGSITALLSAPFSDKISSLILLSIPVVLDSDKTDYDLRIPKELASKQLIIYLKKVFNPKYIIRLLMLKSDYKRIFSYLKAFFKKSNDSKDSTTQINCGVVNSYFFDSYQACRNRVHTFWIFGDNDSFWFDFKREFFEKKLMDPHDSLLVIKDANHMFTLIEWQKKIVLEIKKWLVNEKIYNADS